MVPWAGDDLGTVIKYNAMGVPIEETRGVDPQSGGQKGIKLERFGLMPPKELASVAAVYGFGAKKYADRNWQKGYSWTWSYDALQRHLNLFWAGEFLDSESGLPHLAHAIFHCLALMYFHNNSIGKDDRKA